MIFLKVVIMILTILMPWASRQDLSYLINIAELEKYLIL